MVRRPRMQFTSDRIELASFRSKSRHANLNCFPNAKTSFADCIMHDPNAIGIPRKKIIINRGAIARKHFFPFRALNKLPLLSNRAKYVYMCNSGWRFVAEEVSQCCGMSFRTKSIHLLNCCRPDLARWLILNRLVHTNRRVLNLLSTVRPHPPPTSCTSFMPLRRGYEAAKTSSSPSP